MTKITRSPGSIQQPEAPRPNEVVTDNKDPDDANSIQAQTKQPNLTGEAKGMLDLGGSIVKKSLEDALETGARVDTDKEEQPAAGAAIGYGGKLGIVPEGEQPAAGSAIGYGGKLGIVPEGEQPAAGAAIGYGGKLGIVPEGEQPAAGAAIGYGGKLGIVPDEKK